MRNRLTGPFDRDEPAVHSWQLDHSPGARLALLFSLLVLPFAAVAGRQAYLQGVAAERFLAVFEQTTESFESIPSRDGRILASDGRVLAEDVERFSVQAHYRWLEDPPNERWLRKEAYARLRPSEHRDTEKVTAEQQRVLDQRAQAWSRLATLCGTPLAELTKEREVVQRRVERMAALVQERRAERSHEGGKSQSQTADEPSWRSLWDRVRRELTTPPPRLPEELVLAEEQQSHTLLDNVPRKVAAEIETHPERYPGLRIEVSYRRVYPQGDFAAHTIGARTRLTEEELQRRRELYPDGDPLDYQLGDRIGRMGVERTYERQLRGVRGVRRVVRNRQREIVQTEILREPRPGEDVILALDPPLQERAEQLLDTLLTTQPPESHDEHETGDEPLTPATIPRGGCLVAMDVHSGAILALAAAPRFDLNLLIQPDSAEWEAVLTDPRRPLFPRPTHMTLPPGSVFKALTSIAFLESGQLDPDATLYCQGYLDTPQKHRCYTYRHFGVGHGDMRLADALCRSCNVYFFNAARRIGPEPIVEWARRLGFGQPTGIDLPDEQSGHVPSPDGSSRNQPWYPGDTLGLAIGQSRLMVTPVQVARLMALIANDGTLVTPHVVSTAGPVHVRAADGDSPALAISESRSVAGLSHDVLARVREGLEMVVNHPQGTGHKTVRLKNVPIAGKTGTAEVGGGRPDHAWFAGYVPADQPKIAFVIVLEHAGSGGKVAGPVAREFVKAMLDSGLIDDRSQAVAGGR